MDACISVRLWEFIFVCMYQRICMCRSVIYAHFYFCIRRYVYGRWNLLTYSHCHICTYIWTRKHTHTNNDTVLKILSVQKYDIVYFTHTYTQRGTHTHTCIHVYIHIYTQYMPAYVHVCMQVCEYVLHVHHINDTWRSYLITCYFLWKAIRKNNSLWRRNNPILTISNKDATIHLHTHKISYVWSFSFFHIAFSAILFCFSFTFIYFLWNKTAILNTFQLG